MATLRNVHRVALGCGVDLGRSATHWRKGDYQQLLFGLCLADPLGAYLLVIAVHPGAPRNRLEVGHGEVENDAALRVVEPVGVAGLDLDGHDGVRVGTGGILGVGRYETWVADSECECANAECWGCSRIDILLRPLIG